MKNCQFLLWLQSAIYFLISRNIISIVPLKPKEKSNDMKESPYSRFESDDLILRDELAVDRTLLANERTLLSYLRAGVSLLIAGVSIMHFSYQGWFWLIGLACIPIGAIASIIGVIRYRSMNRAISLVRNQAKREPGKGIGDALSGAGC